MDNVEEILIAGAGGQGILQLGKIIAQSAVEENRYTTYYPTYGAEIRGGTANCSVIISGSEISSPVVSGPKSMIIMNNPSLLKFSRKLVPGGLLIINSSLVKITDEINKGIALIKIPATEIAQNIGSLRCANVVALGGYIKVKKILKESTAISVIKKVFETKPDIVELNIKALKKGIEFKNGI
jgi:2-oxoglutarate ferredoxin oxidoreductase subunit gamma